MCAVLRRLRSVTVARHACSDARAGVSWCACHVEGNMYNTAQAQFSKRAPCGRHVRSAAHFCVWIVQSLNWAILVFESDEGRGVESGSLVVESKFLNGINCVFFLNSESEHSVSRRRKRGWQARRVHPQPWAEHTVSARPDGGRPVPIPRAGPSVRAFLRFRKGTRGRPIWAIIVAIATAAAATTIIITAASAFIIRRTAAAAAIILLVIVTQVR